MDAEEVRQAVDSAVRRRFHVESDGWVGHGTTAGDCYMCGQAAEAATAVVLILSGLAGDRS